MKKQVIKMADFDYAHMPSDGAREMRQRHRAVTMRVRKGKGSYTRKEKHKKNYLQED